MVKRETCLAATGRTGRLIVRFALAKGNSVVALVRSKASADLPGVDMIESDARCGAPSPVLLW